jgi:glucose dehydrogenase
MRFLRTAACLGILTCSLVAQSDWPAFGHDDGGQRYSPLTQITPKNVSKLKLAWTYAVAEPGAPARTEVTPIMAGGMVFAPTTQRTVVALEPETGKEIWKYELAAGAASPLRGVTYWAGDKQNPARIFFGSGDGKLIALIAKTGKLAPGFGNEGMVNLRAGIADKFPKTSYHISTPGSIYRDLIITGSQGQEDVHDGPVQDVRAWDVRTGKLVWQFHTVPHPGEPGYETNPKDWWIDSASPSLWGPMSIDKERGIVFLPLGQPAPQYYGGARPGMNLYASSVVALDASTGKLKWHFQLTHHDVWDFDVSVAPALLDVLHDGKKVPAVVAVSKASLMFFLNRETGQSIFPVEERPVPKGDAPGEALWPTQPFPVKPPPLARLGMRPDEIFTGEPEHEKFCRDLAGKIGGIHNQGAYTPYSANEYRVIFPSQVGGVNFGGVAVDPKTSWVFVHSMDLGGMGKLEKQATDESGLYRRASPQGNATGQARFWDPAKQRPCNAPPWASLMPINANTGDIAWRVPLGIDDELEAKGVHNTGSVGEGGPTVTAGGVLFIAATTDKRFRAFESKTGKLLWETKMDADGRSTPMTYLGKNGKQYVITVSTGLNAYSLE